VDLATGFLTLFAGAGSGQPGGGAEFSGDGGQASAAQFGQIFDVSVTPAGEVLVTDYMNSRIRYVVPDSIQLQCSG
jgi:hypothetical protein